MDWSVRGDGIHERFPLPLRLLLLLLLSPSFSNSNFLDRKPRNWSSFRKSYFPISSCVYISHFFLDRSIGWCEAVCFLAVLGESARIREIGGRFAIVASPVFFYFFWFRFRCKNLSFRVRVWNRGGGFLNLAATMEPRVGNKFRLGRKIGSGSFGEIYLGIWLVLIWIFCLFWGFEICTV